MIDLDSQANEIGIDRKALIKMYSLFITSTKEDLAALKKMYQQKRSSEMKAILHHIRGAAAALELEDITGVVTSLETETVPAMLSVETENVLHGLETDLASLEFSIGNAL